jgi:predicted nucleic acid-binding protein
MLALVSTWHPKHSASAAEVDGRLGRGESLVIAGHSLAELYSVLTRFPPPYRLSPTHALGLIERNFAGAEIVGLEAQGYLALVRDAPGLGVSGGTIYDALIAACAKRAGADTIMTLNERDFARVRPHGIAVVVPADA